LDLWYKYIEQNLKHGLFGCWKVWRIVLGRRLQNFENILSFLLFLWTAPDAVEVEAKVDPPPSVRVENEETFFFF
jgi:hypothetical protein